MIKAISTSVVLEHATYPIPDDNRIEHPEFVVPTEVTSFIIREYGLAGPYKRVADPFLGNADFLLRIVDEGGFGYGIELDPKQFGIGADRLFNQQPSCRRFFLSLFQVTKRDTS